ncbi:hypothetical protein, partial [Ottowia sp.]|uniref:hypothetical protein n=1 Tax=Ottowia sp. TaxID=1898956 RepID=UPI0039E3A66B
SRKASPKTPLRKSAANPAAGSSLPTGSALRIVGSDEPAAGFAADFLNGVLGDALREEARQPPEPAPDDDITSPNPYPVGSTGGTDPASNDSYAYYNAAGEITIVGRGDTGDRSVLEMLEEVASRTVGATVGTIESFGEAASGAARVAANSFIQVGSILTGDLTQDHPVIQQAWREQQQLGETLVNAMLSPRETTSRVIEAVVNRYNAAMALSDPYEQSRALSHLFNDVGQAALGAGYTTGSLVRPGAALARAVGENALTGPAAGGRAAQRGAVGNLNETSNTGISGSSSIPDVLDWSRTSPRTGGDARGHVTENHGSLSLTKPNQGVFYGDPIFVIENSWSIARQQSINPVTVGNRDIYVVPRPNSGYAGGMGGQLENLNYVTIITETGTARIVTGYPSGGTPPLPRNYELFKEVEVK